MAGITLEIAQQQLEKYLAAEAACTLKQSYTIDGRTMTFADLAQIQAGVALWDKRVQQLTLKAAGGRAGRVARIIPNF